MYPELFTFSLWDSTIPIMTFGVCLTIAFGLFYWMLRRLGQKYQINTAFLSVNLLLFFLATFFLSRLFHVLLFLGIPTKSAFLTEYPFWSFFLTPDFFFILERTAVRFLVVFYLLFAKREPQDRADALDIILISGLFATIVGYLWAFLRGQTYGIKSQGIFAVDYLNSNFILADYPRFPIALFYVFFVLLIFSFCYIVKKLRPKEKGLSAGIGSVLFGILWFIGEWWNDSSADNFAYLFGLLTDVKLFNFNQLLSIGMILWGSWKIATIIPSPLSDWILEAADYVSEKLDPVTPYLHKLVRKIQKKFKR